MQIRYVSSIEGIAPSQLEGFFVGWPSPPSPETHLRILRGSQHVVLAIDDVGGHVVGFVTALSDGVVSAYLPLLEVLPNYQGHGIGSELVNRVLERLGELYMVDLSCDPEVEPFYERLGLVRSTGMRLRRYDRQAGL